MSNNGAVVDQVLANYQSEAAGGSGYMRLLEFQEDGTVQVRTYSPSLDSHRRSTSQEFLITSLNGVDGDLDQNGSIGTEDWLLFQSNNLADLSSFGFLDKYARGDLDADGDNDASDFVLFRKFYNAAHGPGAFESLDSLEVPEPTGLHLAVSLVFGLFVVRSYGRPAS